MLTVPAGPAAAQEPETEPIGRFVVDVRGAFAHYGRNPEIAAILKLREPNLPSRGLGVVAGAHWYALRWGVVTFGLGGEMMFSRGRQTLEVNGTQTGPEVRTHLNAISPQVSFNFGARQGWSYISGGVGYSNFAVVPQLDPLPGVEPRIKTINYGGGARWFNTKHVAFSLDLRFYAINPVPASPGLTGSPRMTLLVISAGVSVK